ncbi:hypothetical protein IVB30_32715 [Bradyrhizobium sp. 200]|uniref:hypothetical protein n=1 Tax=Bradyrhizobium sp. 200 TaxID=2782665 RepID=UPI001FFEFA24|nr:hypothetical protein [Bradyrhizobium sp. 200]UPJ47905.1 hypothetical protein IVB30_32715 [Bradyrhizobium sp. 200]
MLVNQSGSGHADSGIFDCQRAPCHIVDDELWDRRRQENNLDFKAANPRQE